jgi:hypothetical protein
VLRTDGAVIGNPWRSKDPALQDLPVLEWVLLSLPIIASPQTESWTGRRGVPPLGQYRLGIDLPLRYEWADPVGREIRSSGFLQRESVKLAENFRGLLQLDHSGKAIFSSTGTLEDASVELRVFFRPEDGSEIRAVYRSRMRCAECPTPATPPSVRPDGPEG